MVSCSFMPLGTSFESDERSNAACSAITLPEATEEVTRTKVKRISLKVTVVLVDVEQSISHKEATFFAFGTFINIFTEKLNRSRSIPLKFSAYLLWQFKYFIELRSFAAFEKRGLQ